MRVFVSTPSRSILMVDTVLPKTKEIRVLARNQSIRTWNFKLTATFEGQLRGPASKAENGARRGEKDGDRDT